VTAAPQTLERLPGFREAGAWPPADLPGTLHRRPGGPEAPHVYALRLPPEPGAWLPELLRGASPGLRDQAERSRRPGRVLERLAAEALLRHAAWERWGLLPGEGALVRNRWGKPRFADRPGDHFNLSHGGGWVLAALHRSPVGVDVEAEHPSRCGALAAVLSEAERREHEALPEAAQAPDFFRRWTLKEALLKAAGRGLSVDPRALDLGGRGLPEGLGAWTDWRLESLPMPAGVHAALCHAAGTGAAEA
jgi:4'-phosphopantetheinyl transferase